jgi:hypothetical protein
MYFEGVPVQAQVIVPVAVAYEGVIVMVTF